MANWLMTNIGTKFIQNFLPSGNDHRLTFYLEFSFDPYLTTCFITSSGSKLLIMPQQFVTTKEEHYVVSGSTISIKKMSHDWLSNGSIVSVPWSQDPLVSATNHFQRKQNVSSKWSFHSLLGHIEVEVRITLSMVVNWSILV